MASESPRLPRPIRTALRVVALAVAVFAVALGVLAAVYSPGYVYRWLAWQDADVGDAARFPERPIAAPDEPFRFSSPDDPEAAGAVVLAALGEATGRDPVEFLESTGTQAFLVVRDDTILYEGYLGGFARGDVATSFSVAKSFVSAMVGIAIEEGLIGGVDDPVTRSLPELAARDPRFAEITIGHLLDMTSGLRYRESSVPWGDDPLTYYFDDLRRLAIEHTEVVGEPGVNWVYNNYNPILLGMVLERATGMPVAGYLETRVWRRIGAEFPASWSLDREDGFEKMESGLNARPIDFAKLGRLYLHGGTWDGEQVVPAEWAAESTDPSLDPRRRITRARSPATTAQSPTGGTGGGSAGPTAPTPTPPWATTASSSSWLRSRA